MNKEEITTAITVITKQMKEHGFYRLFPAPTAENDIKDMLIALSLDHMILQEDGVKSISDNGYDNEYMYFHLDEDKGFTFNAALHMQNLETHIGIPTIILIVEWKGVEYRRIWLVDAEVLNASLPEGIKTSKDKDASIYISKKHWNKLHPDLIFQIGHDINSSSQNGKYFHYFTDINYLLEKAG